MKKVVISIPVHEQPLVVEDLVKNIQKFVPNCSLVLHISGDSPSYFVNSIRAFAKKYDGFLYLNPNSIRTFKADEAGLVTSLSTVHASNFRYMKSIMQFDTFCLNTSNDFLIRKGIENTLNNFDCGFSNINRCPPDKFMSPPTVANLRKVMNVVTCEKGSQEGSFYPFHVFDFIADKVYELMNVLGRTGLDGEEGYIPCMAFSQFPELYNSNSGHHYIYHNPAEGGSVSMEYIHKVRNGELPHVYGVKRVPRIIDHPTRIYVNQLTKDD